LTYKYSFSARAKQFYLFYFQFQQSIAISNITLTLNMGLLNVIDSAKKDNIGVTHAGHWINIPDFGGPEFLSRHLLPKGAPLVGTESQEASVRITMQASGVFIHPAY
jgi:hypothetical protein